MYLEYHIIDLQVSIIFCHISNNIPTKPVSVLFERLFYETKINPDVKVKESIK